MHAALLLLFSALAQAPEAPAPPSAERYRAAALTMLDNLLEHGTDHYGPMHTPMIMSVIDIRTESSPENPEVFDGMIRSEGRLHRRNPAGADLWDDQPLLRTLYLASEITGDKKYSVAADAYIRVYFERARKPNGLLSWGTHIYYDAYKDAPGGDQDGAGPHEILVLCPLWDRMWKVAPEAVRQEIELIWEWHMVDRVTGEHNRHDDKSHGCDFAFSGGEFAYAFAWLFSQTKDLKHLEWARIAAGRHWNTRNSATNLAPDAPATGDRYDAHHCFTTLSGPHAALLFKCFDVTGDHWFQEVALSHVKAWNKYAWDTAAGEYWGMLTLDGQPVKSQEKGEGYDVWKPTGYTDVWRTVMFSYEFPDIAAQTAVDAFERTGEAEALVIAQNWARAVRKHLPPSDGYRWKKELLEALPMSAQIGGTYAESYGRYASFFLHLHHATGNPADLETAGALADEALAKLTDTNGWLRGHPAKPYYESTDGVAYLLYALLELAEYPKLLPANL